MAVIVLLEGSLISRIPEGLERGQMPRSSPAEVRQTVESCQSAVVWLFFFLGNFGALFHYGTEIKIGGNCEIGCYFKTFVEKDILTIIHVRYSTWCLARSQSSVSGSDDQCYETIVPVLLGRVGNLLAP